MKKLAILLIGITMVFVSCKKDMDKPNINVFPTDNEWSVGRILDSLNKLNSYQFDTIFDSNAQNAVVKGYVIGDETSGNIYRTFYLRGEDGKCVAVYRKGASDGGSDEFNVRQGDYVGYKLYGSIISSYNNLPQIQVQEHDVNKLIVIYQRNCTDKVQPIVTTIDSITAGKHLCDLVKLSDVQFESYEGLTYADANATTNRNLVSCSGSSVIVRTSNYASFASDPLPEGRGTLTSVVSVYGSTWQLLLRNPREDVQLTEARCGEGGEVQQMPYVQNFTSSFGTYTTYNALGDQTWVIDYSTAKMTGKAGDFYANEDWLISSPVEILDVEHAKAVVNYVAQYSGPDNDVTIQISSDYEFGENPGDYNWTELSTTFPNTGGWNDFQDVEISLDQFIGQTVTLAVKFISSDTQSRTIEVKSIAIEEGEAGGGGGGGGGDLQQMPYTQDFSSSFGTYTTKSVVGSQVWEIAYSTAKMTGYVSGTNYENEDWLISSPVAVTGVEHAKAVVNYIAKYNAPSADDVTIQISSDYVYGDDPGNATWTQLSATLPNTNGGWEDFEDVEINLDEFIGQTVTFAVKFTSTTSGSRTIEIKSISIEEGGDTPPTPTTIFSETFQSSQGDFQIVDVNIGTLSYVWAYSSQYHCMKGSGYYQHAVAAESWLISPAIDLSGVGSAKLSFDHCCKYETNPTEEMTLWLTSNYTGDVATTQWTQVALTEYGSNFSFVTASDIDLSQFVGGNVYVAFKYVSTDSNAATWEIKNVIVSE